MHPQVAFICHVPKALQEATEGFSIKEWAEAVAKAGNAQVRHCWSCGRLLALAGCRRMWLGRLTEHSKPACVRMHMAFAQLARCKDYFAGHCMTFLIHLLLCQAG